MEEFLTVQSAGGKKLIVEAFMSKLDIYADVTRDSVAKLVTILESLLRAELVTWVIFGVGLDMFIIYGMYEMVQL